MCVASYTTVTRHLGAEQRQELVADREYKCLAQTLVSETMWVSTVWLGLDHGFGRRGHPVIFETMVFDEGEGLDSEIYRYSTEEAAYAGHQEMVLLMRAELDWRTT